MSCTHIVMFESKIYFNSIIWMTIIEHIEWKFSLTSWLDVTHFTDISASIAEFPAFQHTADRPDVAFMSVSCL